ncbi:MAG: hypothetical protein KAV87_65645 [Desulfobacteraceae bacterium]|nr:hypothetical protein [Desulfobacteraceae bacterium]
MKGKLEKLMVLTVVLATGLAGGMANADMVALWEFDWGSGTLFVSVRDGDTDAKSKDCFKLLNCELVCCCVRLRTR